MLVENRVATDGRLLNNTHMSRYSDNPIIRTLFVTLIHNTVKARKMSKPAVMFRTQRDWILFPQHHLQIGDNNQICHKILFLYIAMRLYHTIVESKHYKWYHILFVTVSLSWLLPNVEKYTLSWHPNIFVIFVSVTLQCNYTKYTNCCYNNCCDNSYSNNDKRGKPDVFVK